MSLKITARAWLRVLCLGSMLAIVPAFAAVAPGPGDKDAIVSATPMEIEADDAGAHGLLAVAPEALTPDTRTDLVYTITAEPAYGRVGLSGGENADFFK